MEKQTKASKKMDEEVREQAEKEEEEAPILGGYPLWNDDHTKIIGWHDVYGKETFFDE